MTLKQIVNNTAIDLNDPNYGRFSRDWIVSKVNEGVRLFARASKCFEATGVIICKSGQGVYRHDSLAGLIQVNAIEYNGLPVIPKSIAWLKAQLGASWQSLSGTPKYYTQEMQGNNKLRLVPIPDTDGETVTFNQEGGEVVAEGDGVAFNQEEGGVIREVGSDGVPVEFSQEEGITVQEESILNNLKVYYSYTPEDLAINSELKDDDGNVQDNSDSPMSPLTDGLALHDYVMYQAHVLPWGYENQANQQMYFDGWTYYIKQAISEISSAKMPRASSFQARSK